MRKAINLKSFVRLIVIAAMSCLFTGGAFAMSDNMGNQVPSEDPCGNEQRNGGAQRPPIQGKRNKFDVAIRDNMKKSDAKSVAVKNEGQFFPSEKETGPVEQEEQKKADVPNNQKPNWCTGYIRPDGQYSWCNVPKIGQCKSGQCPNPTLAVPGDNAEGLKATSAVNIPYFEHMVEHTIGLPVHAHSAAMSVALNEVYRNSLSTAFRGLEQQTRQNQQTQTAQSADTQGGACQEASQAAYDEMQEFLINVANENAGTPVQSRMADKPLAGAVWMAQQMYKQVYIPMAVLLLLPGAILTQVKGMVSFGIINSKDEDAVSPITGIIRAVMAVFLIPATQLLVSFCIDTGNSMTDCVVTELKKNGRLERVSQWMREQAFATKPDKKENHIKQAKDSNDTTDPERGKFTNASSKSTVQEKQNNVDVALQNCFNTVNNAIADGLNVLNSFQIVMIFYLFLLGPIAASFFAWPAGIGKDLFKKTFSSWLDGVTVLVLWKFWWCIVLLCMAVRLETEAVDPTSQYELYYFTAFMAMLAFVPFSPFEFRPGDIVTQALERAQQQAGKGGGGGGGGGKASGGGNQNQSKEGKAAPPPESAPDAKGGSGGGKGGNSTGGDDRSSALASASCSPVSGQVNPMVATPPSSGVSGGSDTSFEPVAVNASPPPISEAGSASQYSEDAHA